MNFIQSYLLFLKNAPRLFSLWIGLRKNESKNSLELPCKFISFFSLQEVINLNSIKNWLSCLCTATTGKRTAPKCFALKSVYEKHHVLILYLLRSLRKFSFQALSDKIERL